MNTPHKGKAMDTIYGPPKIHKAGAMKRRPASENAAAILNGPSKYLEARIQELLQQRAQRKLRYVLRQRSLDRA